MVTVCSCVAMAERGGSGGELEMKIGQGVVVAPRMGTLVMFMSHLVPHEVKAASKYRYAMTLWMEAPSVKAIFGAHET